MKRWFAWAISASAHIREALTHGRAPNNVDLVVVIVSILLLVSARLVLGHFDLHPSFFSGNELLLLGLLFLLLSVLLFYLPLECLFDSILLILSLSNEDCFFIAALKNRAFGLELEVQAALEDFTPSHDLGKVALGLHGVLVHVDLRGLIVKGSRCGLRHVVSIKKGSSIEL